MKFVQRKVMLVTADGHGSEYRFNLQNHTGTFAI